jgi:succinate dehydrogenase / fumarate reductase cytochrome b subunit
MASENVTPAGANRPLSPHLQVYRWQWTMALSILHRFTGIGLAIGTLALVGWIAAAAAGPIWFETAQIWANHWVGRLLLFGWTFALFYHLANGIRHLLWDAGRGFELKTAAASAGLVVLAAVVLTALAWLIGYGIIPL